MDLAVLKLGAAKVISVRDVNELPNMRRPTGTPRNRFRASLCSCLLGSLLISATALHAQVASPQSAEPGEYELKAAFLFNFAKFVQWPPSAFVSPQSPFEICILGDDPFGKSIDDVLRGKTVADRTVAIDRLKSLPAGEHCQILFISSSEGKHLPEIFAALKGTSTLAIGETEDFAASGGMIQFKLEEHRVRFIINVDATQQAGLQVSSKLLALAQVVRNAAANGKG
jgi:hypothetical protein